MKVILFGATGMVGQGVLRECLLDPDVTNVLAIVRQATGRRHQKLVELEHAALFDLSGIESELAGFDACFFCLGVSALGMTEENYRRLTYDLTLSIAQTLVRLNSGMTFIYVSGMGTDSKGNSRSMWARVKGETENALLAMPFKAAFMFRPAYIQPMHGVVSKTKWYRVIYAIMGPLFPLWKLLFPKYVTTNGQVGRAMIEVALHSAPKPILENKDINRIRRESK
jgi:uncharacterized protein YbjT (DUF2867 family)